MRNEIGYMQGSLGSQRCTFWIERQGKHRVVIEEHFEGVYIHAVSALFDSP